jgi:hypothetical protein
MGPFCVALGCAGLLVEPIAGEGLCKTAGRAGSTFPEGGAGLVAVSFAGGIVRCCAAGTAFGDSFCAPAFEAGELEWNSHTNITINTMEATAYTQNGNPERSGLRGYSVFGGSGRTICGTGCSWALAIGFDWCAVALS